MNLFRAIKAGFVWVFAPLPAQPYPSNYPSSLRSKRRIHSLR